MSRRVFLGRASALAAGAVVGGGSLAPVAAWAEAKPKGMLAAAHGPAVANAWVRELYRLVRIEGYVPDPPPPGQTVFLPGFTPNSAARLYGYAGIAMYEAVVGGMPDHASLATQLNGMPHLPGVHPHAVIDWPTALSAAVAATVGPLYNRADSRGAVAAFHADVVTGRTAAGVPAGVLRAAEDHGKAIAAALQRWIAADGFSAIRARAEAETYVPPAGPGLWVPTHPNYGPAIEPYWEGVRPFVLRRADEVPAPQRPVPFSTAPGSAFWEQAMGPFRADPRSPSLPPEERRERQGIAQFWTDNPIQSGLPSGHWMLIHGQFAVQHSLDLARTVEGYARLGITLADAFLSCWTEKYRTNLLRPVTYIRDVVQAGMPEEQKWATFVNTPQFPEFPSGHSVSSLAAATVLTDLYGTKGFTDTYTLARIGDDYEKTRVFTSFTQAAEQAAQSRIYGGIHYPMGVEIGKDQGRRVGALVVKRLRTRKHR